MINTVENILIDYKNGMLCKDISKKYNIGLGKLNYYREKYKIPTRVKSHKRITNNKSWTDLSREQKQILLGSLLGDGGLKNRKNSCFVLEHCEAQKSYIEYKFRVLKEFCYDKPLYYREKKSLRSDSICKSYSFTTICCPLFSVLRNKWYLNSKKIIDINNIKELDALGLAIWYMDDGNYSRNGNVLKLFTNGFTLEENQLLQKFLKDKFDLYFTISTIDKYFYLSCYGDEMRKLKKIVEPYVLDCLKYKINIKEKKKTKFSIEDVKNIRVKYQQGFTQRELAKQYNCAYQDIQRVVYNKNYKYV